MLREHFAGENIGLSDHFSAHFDGEDLFHNVFNLSIGSDGRILDRVPAPHRWYMLDLRWKVARGNSAS